MIEYRVKRVERFIVTRHEEDEAGTTGSNRQIGKEYDSFETAYEVGYAMARADQERLELPPGDTSVIFPSQSLEDARASSSSVLSGALIGGAPTPAVSAK